MRLLMLMQFESRRFIPRARRPVSPRGLRGRVLYAFGRTSSKIGFRPVAWLPHDGQQVLLLWAHVFVH